MHTQDEHETLHLTEAGKWVYGLMAGLDVNSDDMSPEQYEIYQILDSVNANQDVEAFSSERIADCFEMGFLDW